MEYVIIRLMPLSHQEVDHIASLARLDLTEDEKSRYREQLSAILDHVAQLQKLNTSGTDQAAAGNPNAETPLRMDEARPGLSPEALLKSAFEKDRSQFKIPPVFE